MTATPKLDTEALVVGAGPVGLAMACELRRHGVACRIVDQNAGPTPPNESRALGLQARTLEVFRAVGVIDPVLAQARKLHGLGAYAEGRRVLHLSLDLDEFDTPYPFVLILPQARTERILLDRLAAHGGSVERGMALARFAQDGEGVTATFADGREVRARWLIGCDGARSVVRKGLNLAFEGGEYEERFLIADLRVTWGMPDDEIAMVLTPEGPLVGFPLPGGHWRLVDTTGIVDSSEPERIVARFRELVNRYVAPDATVDDPAWTSSFHIHRRVVDRYREGRCFVAGDAAHLHSPAGGQGLNTGIQDAFNLSWKLGLVARGAARESLLDSYTAERRPVAQAVLRGSDRATRMVALRGEVAQHLRNGLLGVLGEFDFVRRRIVLGLSELGIAYRGSPIVAEDCGGLLHAILPHAGGPGLRDHLDFGAAPHPGDRAPDVAFAAPASGGPARLFDVLGGTGHTLLLFEGSSADPGDPIAAVGDLARSRYADRIRTLLVSRGDRPASPWPGEVLTDPAGDLHRRYGAAAACLYLIRPDGYVGYRAQPPDAGKLGEYLGRIFVA